jgi:acyl-CoA synthetase (AMP-forming)/AMP-acid ligase II
MSSTIDKDHIYHSLLHAAATWPHHIAVADEFGSLTFSQLLEQVEISKNGLIQCGVREGTGLAVITKNSRSFIIGLYAGLAANAVVMPLANYQRPEEIRKALTEARLHFVLMDNVEMASAGREVKTLETTVPLYVSVTGFDLNKKTVSFISDAAVMRFTSGTTGDAKCVVLSHKSVLERVDAANEGLQLSENDRVIWVLPMAYHFIVSIMLYIRYGAGIIICDDFLAEHIAEKAEKYHGTFLYASPMHIRLLATSKKELRLPALKRAISTTTGISPAVCKSFEDKFNLPVSQAFGIIEVGLPIVNLRKSAEHPGAVGYALPAFDIAILDHNLQLLPAGAIGKLAIKGPGMFDGYLSPPTERQQVLKDGWFLTGDLAIMNDDGLIEIKGREKNVINVSGNKVFPNEVEEAINRFPGMVNSKVYGQVHPLIGEIVTADVMVTDKDNFDQEELIRHCRKLLSSFKIPQRIRVVDGIEMTDSGKIKR